MAAEVSTIQSLKAVDAWIDVINANINGGVRTAFKSSRLKFGGSNTDVNRAGTTSSLPLQFPEPGLTTANTVIDFSQGAITTSTENSHLAIQGEGFFLLASPDAIETAPGALFGTTRGPNGNARFLLTRDGEFRTNQHGFLVNAQGYYLVNGAIRIPPGVVHYDTTVRWGVNSGLRAVYNNRDQTGATPTGSYVLLSTFLTNPDTMTDNNNAAFWATSSALVDVVGGKQSLHYSTFGSTVYDFGHQAMADAAIGTLTSPITLANSNNSKATILSKSLEASNASMTQSVPELSLAQKLFSALTKVLQTKQTNVDGVLNLVR
jgi:flagellar hook protein FlgE